MSRLTAQSGLMASSRVNQNFQMLNIIGRQNSIANQFMQELRDVKLQEDRFRFRHNLERLGEIMAYEISKTFLYSNQEVQTPLGKTSINIITDQPVLITVMRAGLPFFAGFQRFFDRAGCGFVGAYRKEDGKQLAIQLDYLATPDLEGKVVIMVDPMLATGRSVTDTVKKLSTRGKPKYLHLASVVAAPQGIQHLQQEVKHPSTIWTFAVDERLNEQFYIVPGLGDAGDLCFGEKL